MVNVGIDKKCLVMDTSLYFAIESRKCIGFLGVSISHTCIFLHSCFGKQANHHWILVMSCIRRCPFPKKSNCSLWILETCFSCKQFLSPIPQIRHSRVIPFWHAYKVFKKATAREKPVIYTEGHKFTCFKFIFTNLSIHVWAGSHIARFLLGGGEW